MLGLSRQTLGKALAGLAQRGVIRLGYRSIDILRPELLEREDEVRARP